MSQKRQFGVKITICRFDQHGSPRDEKRGGEDLHGHRVHVTQFWRIVIILKISSNGDNSLQLLDRSSVHLTYGQFRISQIGGQTNLKYITVDMMRKLDKGQKLLLKCIRMSVNGSSCIIMPSQGAYKPGAGFEHKTALREAREGHHGTHMGFIKAVVTVSNHVQ